MCKCTQMRVDKFCDKVYNMVSFNDSEVYP